jgi:hypothetical protein
MMVDEQKETTRWHRKNDVCGYIICVNEMVLNLACNEMFVSLENLISNITIEEKNHDVSH